MATIQTECKGKNKLIKIKHALHLGEKSKIKATRRKIIIMENKESNTGITVIPKVENPKDETENVFNCIIQEMKELICTRRIHCVPENW